MGEELRTFHVAGVAGGETFVPFRKPVLDRRSTIQDAPIRTYLPGARWIIALTLFTLALFAVVFSQAAHGRREIASGHVVPASGIVAVLSPRGGIVQEVFVKEGDVVQAGQALFRVSNDIQSELGVVGDLLVQAEARQAQAGAQQLQLRREQLLQERERLQVQGLRLSQDLTDFAEQRALLARQREMANGTVSRAQRARDEGFVTQLQFQQWESAAIQATLAVAGAEQRLRTAQAELSSNQIAARSLELQLQEISAQAMGSDASSFERRINLASQRSVVVVAEISGTVSALNLKIGQTVAAGAAAANLLPPDRELIAEIWLPSKAIGFVQPGDSAQIKYDAFPYEHFGFGSGKVQEVASSPRPVPAEAGSGSEESFYRVAVALDEQVVTKDGKSRAIRPGMKLEAAVVLEERSMLEWLLEPILKRR